MQVAFLSMQVVPSIESEMMAKVGGIDENLQAREVKSNG